MSAQTAGLIPVWTRGDRLGRALRAAGVQKQEMADYLGVSRNTVGNYIADRGDPSRATMIAWAMKCGVNLAWLEHGEAPHPAGPDEGLSYTARDLNPEPADSVSATVYHLIPRMRYTDDDERHTA